MSTIREKMAESDNMLIQGLSEDVYHADPCPTPSLSSSSARDIIAGSPYHAWHKHPRYGNANAPPTKKMLSGSLSHRMLLGNGASVGVVEADSWRTNAAKESRDTALGLGKIPCLRAEFDAASSIALARKEALLEHGIVLPDPSDCEVSMFWKDFGVWHRARADAIDEQNHVIYDLKETSACSSLHIAERHLSGMLYQIQAASYIEGAERTHYETTGRWRFVFLVMEPDQPYCVTPFEAGESFLQLGRMQWDRAKKAWRHAQATGKFPRPQGGKVSANSFELSRETELTYVQDL